MFKKIIKLLLGQPTGYVSQTDEFLANMRKQNAKPSASQQATIAEHAKISAMRDGKVASEKATGLWRDF